MEAWCKIEEDKIMEREKFNTKVYRNEFKYMLTNQQLSLLKNKLLCIYLKVSQSSILLSHVFMDYMW